MVDSPLESEWANTRKMSEAASRSDYLARVAEGKVVEVGSYRVQRKY